MGEYLPPLLQESIQVGPHHVRDVEDAADVDGGIGAIVQGVARLVVGPCHVAVELLMLPLADLLGLHHPEGLERERERERERQREREAVVKRSFTVNHFV